MEGGVGGKEALLPATVRLLLKIGSSLPVRALGVWVGELRAERDGEVVWVMVLGW